MGVLQTVVQFDQTKDVNISFFARLCNNVVLVIRATCPP